jgi:serine/threonine-protein kinase RsbW
MPADKRSLPQLRLTSADRESLVLQGDPGAVRGGLARLMAGPLVSRLNEDSQGTVQIVLAEVLNNIAEHAYAQFPGQIEVTLTSVGGMLCCRTEDSGLPMPGGELPGGKLSEATTLQDLPEGGFGWFLIRSLTQALSYQRQGARNILNFCVDVDDRG